MLSCSAFIFPYAKQRTGADQLHDKRAADQRHVFEILVMQSLYFQNW